MIGIFEHRCKYEKTRHIPSRFHNLHNHSVWYWEWWKRISKTKKNKTTHLHIWAGEAEKLSSYLSDSYIRWKIIENEWSIWSTMQSKAYPSQSRIAKSYRHSYFSIKFFTLATNNDGKFELFLRDSLDYFCNLVA